MPLLNIHIEHNGKLLLLSQNVVNTNVNPYRHVINIILDALEAEQKHREEIVLHKANEYDKLDYKIETKQDELEHLLGQIHNLKEQISAIKA